LQRVAERCRVNKKTSDNKSRVHIGLQCVLEDVAM